MTEYLLAVIALFALGGSTEDFCDEPSPGPGGSPIHYCEAKTESVVETEYFTMVVPAGGWYAVWNDGRSGAMQPNLSVSHLMLHIDLLDPKRQLDVLSTDYGRCVYTSAGAERLCENEIDGPKTMERILIGDGYAVRALLVERYVNGPLLPIYRSAVLDVSLPP